MRVRGGFDERCYTNDLRDKESLLGIGYSVLIRLCRCCGLYQTYVPEIVL